MANVLLVDDDPFLLDSLHRLLQIADHNVVAAQGPAQARQHMQSHYFDVAVVDYQMPAENGLEILADLRTIQPGCMRVLMSGTLDLPTVVDAVNRGEVFRVLEKPFPPERLVTLVDEGISSRQRLSDLSTAVEMAQARAERDQIMACLEGDVLRLAIQPIVDANSSKIVAYEALMRSSHPVLRTPLEVLDAAERLAMLPQLSDVLTARAAAWLPKLAPDVKLFVNLHPAEFAECSSLETRTSKLVPWAQRVVFEITERSRVLDFEAWEKTMQRMRGFGFAIAVDDLGAGYSSLSVLAEVQPEYLKVDMSIVRDVHKSPRKQKLIDLLCRFAQTTDAKLIAEGVECAEEAAALRAAGAHMLQGYYFGRPGFDVR